MRSVEKGWLAEEIWECQQNASDWGDLSQPGQLWRYLFRAQKHLCMSLPLDSLAQLFSSSSASLYCFFVSLRHGFQMSSEIAYLGWRSSGFGLVVLSSAYGCLSARWAVWDITILSLCMWVSLLPDEFPNCQITDASTSDKAEMTRGGDGATHGSSKRVNTKVTA